jgi:hypothetical protein
MTLQNNQYLCTHQGVFKCGWLMGQTNRGFHDHTSDTSNSDTAIDRKDPYNDRLWKLKACFWLTEWWSKYYALSEQLPCGWNYDTFKSEGDFHTVHLVLFYYIPASCFLEPW